MLSNLLEPPLFSQEKLDQSMEYFFTSKCQKYWRKRGPSGMRNILAAALGLVIIRSFF
jgi:hypothetical protein